MIDFNSKKVLIAFPHPDDESMFCSGVIQRFIKHGSFVNVVCLTKGENSTLKYQVGSQTLSDTRVAEFESAMNALGVKNFSVLNFPDGGVEEKAFEVTFELKETLAVTTYDYVFTYEPCGAYGHPDHVALSAILTKMLESQSKTKLIYCTVKKGFSMPKEMLKMAKDPKMVKPLNPNYIFKLSFNEVLTKLKALKCHKSQFNPLFLMPLLFGYGDLLYKEHFTIVNESSLLGKVKV